MNKYKIISSISLVILLIGLGLSIYEFFFITFPQGVLDPAMWIVAIPMIVTIIAPIINFAVVYFSNKSRAKGDSLFLASIYSLGLFALLQVIEFPSFVQMSIWTPIFVALAIILIIASYFLTRKK